MAPAPAGPLTGHQAMAVAAGKPARRHPTESGSWNGLRSILPPLLLARGHRADAGPGSTTRSHSIELSWDHHPTVARSTCVASPLKGVGHRTSIRHPRDLCRVRCDGSPPPMCDRWPRKLRGPSGLADHDVTHRPDRGPAHDPGLALDLARHARLGDMDRDGLVGVSAATGNLLPAHADHSVVGRAVLHGDRLDRGPRRNRDRARTPAAADRPSWRPGQVRIRGATRRSGWKEVGGGRWWV